MFAFRGYPIHPFCFEKTPNLERVSHKCVAIFVWPPAARLDAKQLFP